MDLFGPSKELTNSLLAQAHVTMAVMDVTWCHVYVYQEGSASSNKHSMAAIFLVEKDENYWANLYNAIASFWFQNVVPAKLALANEDLDEVCHYVPSFM